MIGKLNTNSASGLLHRGPKPTHLLRVVSKLSADKVVQCGRFGDIKLRAPKQSDYDEVFRFQEAMYKSGVVFWGNTTRFHAVDWVDWAVKATAAAKAAITIADLSGRIAGIATIASDYAEDGGGALILGVAPWAENNRVGSNLTANSLEKAALIGFPRVTLYVGRANIYAQQIYKKHGFIKSSGGIKTIKMVREL